jgi:hypothetical protein
VQGPSGRRGPNGRNGKRGASGKNGKDGKNGKHGKDGKPGKKGPAGIKGKKGPKGDSCKSELQVHLNALKSYVDMKFDVLKGLVDKSMTRTADSGVVEDTDSSEKMDSLQQNLEQTFTKLTKA